MSTRSTISKKAAITDPDQGPAPGRKRMTVPDFMARKGGEPLVCLTSYTAHVAHICDAVCDLLLVGDSLGMVIHGMPNTLGVTLEHMIMHGQAVVRGADKTLVVVDMPFGSFEESMEVAFRNASRVVKETGCHAVKLEGGVEMAPTIRYLSRRGIPVMAHVGLMPQSMNVMGGFKAVRDEALWDQVIEGVAAPLADRITAEVSIPTIGIGASAQCDGQILVFEDMVGLMPRVPTFVKRYGTMEEMMRSAVGQYADEVRDRSFPGDEHTYKKK